MGPWDGHIPPVPAGPNPGRGPQCLRNRRRGGGGAGAGAGGSRREAAQDAAGGHFHGVFGEILSRTWEKGQVEEFSWSWEVAIHSFLAEAAGSALVASCNEAR
jgi:hypothetical protein